ncbi:MAG: hypothetical protein IJM36_00945 [Acholeplasmatales bacterium]|nr:hypothetical protein [Acholeplasmatales bacterium]
MRKVNKKILISILTSVIVMITIVATTFAWVGIFTYANIDNFSINLKISELDANYFLTISATGEKGSFSDEADSKEIKKQVLMNLRGWSKEYVDSIKDDEIDELYSKYCITRPSSCILTNDGRLSDFYTLNNKNTDYYETYHVRNSYIKFDIYLSVNTKEGIRLDEEGKAPMDIDINSNVFITELENTLVGTLCKQKLTNSNPYKDMDDLPSIYSALKQLPNINHFNMNSANATRFALCMYDPIDINSSYNEDALPIKTLIYHGGEQLPTLDGDVFDLGGILPEEYNTALRELLIIRPHYNNSIYASYNQNYYNDLNKAIDRGQTDLDLVEANSKIWTKTTNVDAEPYLGVHNGVQTKQKISVYFWFEGWDSDCIVGIDEKPVTLNLTLTAGVED